MLQGALHLHSTYSDGELTLAEIREIYLAAGCRFVCITDHADAFVGDEEKRAAYVRECADRSDDQFQFVPGLEYTCVDRMHILGYGVTEPIDSIDPETIIARIAGLGGLAVIAHPKDAAFAAIETFRPRPKGIEVWNTKYDSRYAPRPATFALLQRVRAQHPDVLAFYGQDLHWRRQYRGMFVMVDCATPCRADVLRALGSGRYHGLKDGQALPSDGVLPAAALAAYERAHARSRRVRESVRAIKRWADGFGITVPVTVKAQLRRIF